MTTITYDRERIHHLFFLPGIKWIKLSDEYICTPSNSGIYCKKESINIT